MEQTDNINKTFTQSILIITELRRRSNQSILKEISPEDRFIGRTDAEAETPRLWPPDAKN